MEEKTDSTPPPAAAHAVPAWRPFIYAIHAASIARRGDPERLFGLCHDLGFSTILLSGVFSSGEDTFLVSSHHHASATLAWASLLPDSLRRLVDAACRHGLGIMLDLPLDRIARDGVLAARKPHWCLPDGGERLAARLNYHDHGAEILAYWRDVTAMLLDAGIAGLRCDAPQRLPPACLQGIIHDTRLIRPDCRWIGWTAGLDHAGMLAVAATGVDMVTSSIAWWDRHSDWLLAERQDLPAGTGLLACPVPLPGPAGMNEARAVMALRLAAAMGDGVLIPAGFECASGTPVPSGSGPDDPRFYPPTPRMQTALRQARRLITSGTPFARSARDRLLGTDGAATVIIREGQAGRRRASRPRRMPLRLILANPSVREATQVRLSGMLAGSGTSFACFHAVDGAPDYVSSPTGEITLAPDEVRVLQTGPGTPIYRNAPPATQALRLLPRIVIESVTPCVESGRFPARAIVGDSVGVEADIFMDGHDLLQARLLWRPAGDTAWRSAPMAPIGNSRWRSYMPLDRMGMWEFTIEAWEDHFGTYIRDLRRRRDAGTMEQADIADGCLLLAQACTTMTTDAGRPLSSLLERISATTADHAADLLLSPHAADIMARADPRAGQTGLPAPLSIMVDREAGRFGSWYELFPRSLDGAGRHGTLRDVIDRLPAIRAMGFSVLYLPPIHPIGHVNRKGPNNALHAGADDPGSPYAIGSAAGGHDTIHPELGTIADFHALVETAQAQGMELALDLAIQCAPDHPWVRTHPEWFAHRADGSIRHAENPPKKYEDIVNLDFYAPGAIPGLWEALRDIVLAWVGHGVRIFRVDNPHTKPLPFWEWMMDQVRARHPDVLFLAEAFTTPGMMYRLAMAGFSQSYTYFTWRTTKAELTEYMTELTTPPVSDFFRPHFFVNTPDINPFFLQTSGRAGHLIRAALACTLSGLWGMYSGFELCEARALPGREEYQDSEKYQIRQWDWARPGNIIAEITALNALRQRHPALQSHMGLRFFRAFNDQILYFGRMTDGMTDVILVAVSLDPMNAQEADFEIPLWEWKLSDNASLVSHDLLRDRHETWTGKIQHMRLDPGEMPFTIWQVSPAGKTT
ncbi:maltotransferase domain-containing protein [Komagataeibacter sp. FNDCF1]|uniref:maltotransferase domain-containing protein n=1 Tax=Komagataeibacter sp. FNDCF1 TaxID=2878681 RepID=UPI001E5C08E5|nr:maltotransferase domain-containing protein [Komagataeibacter sp. FNDCF1]MCE2563559.1 DUF3416 domain-containing protein [Komagataeibacter sp. FNDCF1]